MRFLANQHWVAACAAFAVWSGMGCGTPAEHDSSPAGATQELVANPEIEAFMHSAGFTGKALVNREMGIVVVDGDIGFELEQVQSAMESQAPGDLVRKGYTLIGQPIVAQPTPDGTALAIPDPIPSSVVGNIRLRFVEPGEHRYAVLPNHAFWKASFRNAATKWSNAFFNLTTIDISESNTGAEIQVMTGAPNFCGEGCIMLAFWPNRGEPGPYIILNPSAVPNCPGGWAPPGCSGGGCFTRMETAALHEIGHTLGFVHPDVGHANGLHIDGTEAFDPSKSLTQQYPSVMHNGSANLCNANAQLSADDHWSAVIMYD